MLSESSGGHGGHGDRGRCGGGGAAVTPGFAPSFVFDSSSLVRVLWRLVINAPGSCQVTLRKSYFLLLISLLCMRFSRCSLFEHTRVNLSLLTSMHYRLSQYDGHKELYVNQRLVYSVKKECTDGNMNCWSLRLSFGRVNLQLTAKLISASGFEYTMRLGNRKGVILYRAC